MLRRTAVFGALFLMLIPVVGATYYQLSFQGMQLGSETVDAGSDLNVTANIVNMRESPYTDLQVVAYLVRDDDSTQVAQQTLVEDLDLAGREFHTVDASVDVPADAVSGDHLVQVAVVTPAGTPMAIISERVNVEGDTDEPVLSFGQSGVYVVSERVVTGNNSVRTIELPSFGTEGENLLPDRNFSIDFELQNPGEVDVDASADISIAPTYGSGETVRSYSRDLGTIAGGETANYSFTERISEPGTYEVRVTIRDGSGEEIGESSVRLVIAGGGGSIIDLNNQQDTYGSGEEVGMDASVVGPADGDTVIRGAYLRMEVMKDGAVVEEREQSITELPFSPEEYSFSFDAPEQLQEYTVEMTLGKDDTVYDTYTASYQPLEAEKTFTESGQVQESGMCYDDGVCTAAEYDRGGCFDCVDVDQRPEPVADDTNQTDDDTDDDEPEQDGSRSLIYGGVAAAVVLAGIVYLWRRR